jgi:protein-tyrosine-phosphatase
MILSRNKISVSHKARQITVDDFKNFEYIVGMDQNNMMEHDGKQSYSFGKLQFR